MVKKPVEGGSSDVADWYIFSEGFMKEKKCENFNFYVLSLIKVFILANIYIFNFSL